MVKKDKKDDSKKLTSDFTDAFIEKIILNKVYTEKQYTLFFEGIFDKRWFEDDRIDFCQYCCNSGRISS
jgi:hypothetical protein